MLRFRARGKPEKGGSNDVAGLSLRNVKKSFGEVAVVHGVDLEIADREFVVFVGPSGCGKSTLLRMIAGLEDITSGEIAIDGRVVNELDPKDRDIAMVFQDYALYPHMTVFENMAFSLRYRGIDRQEIRRRVDEAARILDIEPYIARMPRQLSGGQRQRVAMGRAIVRQPKVFLFDEPLSNLDAKLRAQTRIEIQKLHRELGITSLFVTHDQVEAMTLAQRMIVMNAGRMEQFGTPEEVYHRPASTFVASFIGSPPMNLMKNVPGSRAGALLGIRPEHLDVGDAGGEVRTETVEMLGAERLIYGRIGDEPLIVRVEEQRPAPAVDQVIRVRPREDRLHWFDAASGRRMAA
jgi:sn-glycerol 3-phosphate transport system ATP-binding protein